MMTDDAQDASFEDGTERPLRLAAETEEDLRVISALVQDAVTGRSDVAWLAKRHRFALLVNRFRWEDADAARRQGRDFERVRSLLSFDSVLRVRSDGIDPEDRDSVYALLSMEFQPTDDASGVIRLFFSGDGEIALDVECIDARLTDVTRPYAAPSRSAPDHPEN